MENDIYWDVFRDTGDPLCWLLTRDEAGPDPAPTPPEGTEEESSAPA